MSIAPNQSYAELAEPQGACQSNDVECAEHLFNPDTDYEDYDEERDYEPPMPYCYSEQWAENPAAWAISYAADLIRVHECGPDFYKNLDVATIEAWVFEDWPELIRSLYDGNAFSEFRTGLSEYCREIQAAALLAEEILLYRERGVSSLVNSSACEEFFPGWLKRIRTEEDWAWHAQLPGMVAELRGRWTNREFSTWRESDHIVPNSRFRVGDCIPGTPERRESVTAHVLEDDTLISYSPSRTRERVALVIRLPADVNVEALTKWDRTTLEFHANVGGDSSVGYLSLGSGVLLISLQEHEAILKRFRSRLPVMYICDNEELFVEYSWNPMAFGREFMQRATGKSLEQGAMKAQPRLLTEPRPQAIRIERTCPMSSWAYSNLFVSSQYYATHEDEIPF